MSAPVSSLDTAPAPAPTPQDAAPARPRWQTLLIRPETMTFILLVVGIFAGSQLSPFFLEVEGKGHFFEEPLATVGAAKRSQLYGEIGLEYGNEKAHAQLRGLPVFV